MSGFDTALRIEQVYPGNIAPQGGGDGNTGTTRTTAHNGNVFVIGQGQFELLQRAIFGQGRPAFAVLDGAGIDDLPALLQQHAPEAMCLFSGELDPMLAAAAPYLVPLRNGSPVTQLALRDGWNSHWGIVLVTDADTTLLALRSHLRRILRVAAPGGESMLFRFYDPRAFRTVVPTFDEQQHKVFFGPIHGCYVESRDTNQALYFARDNQQASAALPLSAAA
jgi:hypothetical protein